MAIAWPWVRKGSLITALVVFGLGLPGVIVCFVIYAGPLFSQSN